jgi:tripartite-type tricarboxylate transporter receptor subunit TctC
MPDVPTVAESGPPGFEASNWYGSGPRGHAAEIVARLNAERRALRDAEVCKKLAGLGFEIKTTPQEFTSLLGRPRSGRKPGASALESIGGCDCAQRAPATRSKDPS